MVGKHGFQQDVSGASTLQGAAWQQDMIPFSLKDSQIGGIYRLGWCLSRQNRALSGRPERLHPAGDDQRGGEDAVSGGGGSRLLPVTDGPVQHGCERDPLNVPTLSILL